jgi:hypothetical protein
MIGSRIKAKAFFDRNVIKTNWRKINETPAKKAGLLVRRISINSIRKDRSKAQTPSKPGRPPKSRAAGHPMKLIYSVPLRLGTGVIVGPVGFSKKPAPGTLEHGGSRVLTDKQRIALLQRQKRLLRMGRDVRGRHIKKGTKAQLANIKRVAVTEPRPFMGPALVKARPKIPVMWRRSISG